MAGDPNARRDKALENIAGSLNELNRNIKKLIAVESLKIGEKTPAPPDPFQVPQSDAVPMTEQPEKNGPPRVQSNHPYFKPSEDTNAAE